MVVHADLGALVCRIGTRLCALPVDHVVETMRPLPVEPLAQMPSFVLGLSIVRGSPLPVIDGRALLGAPAASPPERFVVIRVAERRAAVAVDEVMGVRRLAAAELGALPPMTGAVNADLVTAVGTADRALLVVLATARLVPDEVFAAMESIA